jgi:hypothetical protein
MVALVTAAIGLWVGFVAAAWFFGGPFGAVVGALAVVAHAALRPKPSAYWAGAVAAMSVAMLAMFVQGLSGGSVLGSGFAERHLVAHGLVGVSLASAVYASLLELTGLEGKLRRANGGRHRRSPGGRPDPPADVG